LFQPKQPFAVAAFIAAKRHLLPRSGRSAESAKYDSPGQAALKARAALGETSHMAVFLGLFGPSRRS